MASYAFMDLMDLCSLKINMPFSQAPIQVHCAQQPYLVTVCLNPPSLVQWFDSGIWSVYIFYHFYYKYFLLVWIELKNK